MFEPKLISRRPSSHPSSSINQQQLQLVSKISGWSLIAMFFAAMYAEMLVRTKLIIPNNVHQTIQNVNNNSLLFYSGLLGYLIILMCDLIVSVGMHILMKRFDRKLSWIVASMRVIYTCIFSFAIIQLFIGFQLALSPKFEKQLSCMPYFEWYEKIFSGALILFGIYLICTAWLCKKSNLIYKWVCAVLAVAGFAYCVDNLLKLSNSTEYYIENYQSIVLPLVAIPAIVGEVGLAISLIRQ